MMLNRKIVVAVIMTGLLAVAGCAAGPKANPALEDARAAYARAKATPGIMENAQVPMHDADRALKKAAQAEEDADVSRMAKLAQDQVDYAVLVAEQKMAEQKIESLNQEKQNVLLENRQREIERAQKEAASKQHELEVKAREIELARQQVEEARQKTLEMQTQAEAARKDAEAKAIEAEMARQKAEALEREMADMKAHKTERGLVLTLGDVLFSSGKADLMPGAMRTLDKLTAFLKENPERNLVIEGHTDNVGSDAFNLDLSQRRADSVRNALMNRGVGSDRISTKGYGERYPVAGNETRAGRQQNRRVEIIILDEGVSGSSILRN
ncbi:flagellar motor protein MotB [Desulfonema ishimotonii]|uniref:Flagellar motor protein MotB n=1 Tax=Desulfonema ishimotonii TaxID=45657 RepID=A0A401G195_9BACT|nr:OmpA family protein [Desulfonema ishimotonii]GBC62992.1 flagellar motor protein MotB [Desulfonema ishimotonii]